MNASESFRAAMRRAGLDFAGPINADGRLHRFKAEGDKARNSWFVLFAGPPAGGKFGCWKKGFSETWHERNGELSQAEWKAVRQGWKDADSARQRTEAELRDKARATASWILAHSTAANPLHPYLARKGVSVHGELRQWRGALVLPLRDVDGELHSLEFVGADGTKRFLTGGRVAGCFFTVCDKADVPLVLCEGYATSASVAEATGLATVAAMNCGNLQPVGKMLRAKWPDREFIVAADDDTWTAGNPGLLQGRDTAVEIGARLAFPEFANTTSKPTDFNDLMKLQGLDAVRTQIESAEHAKETDA